MACNFESFFVECKLFLSHIKYKNLICDKKTLIKMMWHFNNDSILINVEAYYIRYGCMNNCDTTDENTQF
ncbi:hypothetical protein GCM10007140_11380 [Priestia taiwanensis]|uniref:Uncharacterized protein n=1 Tax=Priestia taiwanensis TaxID=1347902 RepID=A0A917AN98_9BACI|nr:hypothetical protein GCM10007140_11380 [Priestia taiwanensis]